MPSELTVLVLVALLQMVQLGVMAVFANLEVGTAKTLSPRDSAKLGGTLIDQLSLRTARQYRAINNHFEALLLFAIAVMAVVFSGQSTVVTQSCAVLYLIARIVYVPAYTFGWVPWRSVFWFVGFLATACMLVIVVS